MKAVKAWAVVHPFGEIDLGAIGESEKEAWYLFLDSTTYTRMNADADGYRCIPVTITAEEAKE